MSTNVRQKLEMQDAAAISMYENLEMQRAAVVLIENWRTFPRPLRLVRVLGDEVANWVISVYER